MDKMKSLDDLLMHELEDLYSAESQLVKALPKMAEKATDAQLKKAIEMHLKETERQIERLDQVFKELGEKPGSHTCKAMAGLIAEGEEVLKSKSEPEVLDAAIIAASQRIEHYEIAGYGTARWMAQFLGQDQVAKLLEQTLNEEQATDTKLNEIAINKVNKKAGRAAA